jgi:hypothetical protein
MKNASKIYFRKYSNILKFQKINKTLSIVHQSLAFLLNITFSNKKKHKRDKKREYKIIMAF